MGFCSLRQIISALNRSYERLKDLQVLVLVPSATSSGFDSDIDYLLTENILPHMLPDILTYILSTPLLFELFDLILFYYVF